MVYDLQDVYSRVVDMRSEPRTNRSDVMWKITENQIEVRNLLHKQQQDMETRIDHIHLTLNALFALGTTFGVIWLYYKYKSEEQPMLDCNSLEEKPKDEQRQANPLISDCNTLEENPEDEQKQADPPMYPNLSQPQHNFTTGKHCSRKTRIIE
jgi:hypothetical protein